MPDYSRLRRAFQSARMSKRGFEVSLLGRANFLVQINCAPRYAWLHARHRRSRTRRVRHQPHKCKSRQSEKPNRSRKVGMRIVTIGKEDIEQLAALYRELVEHEPDVAKMREAFLQISSNANHIVLGAKDARDRLVGSCMGVICGTLVGKCRPFMVVEDVVVGQSARRTGIGRELIAALENHARQRGCSYIFLLTDADRPDAQKFYLSLGYHADAYRGFKKMLASNT